LGGGTGIELSCTEVL